MRPMRHARLTAVIVIVVAAGALITGVATAFFSQSKSQPGSVAIARVTLGADAPASATCGFSSLAPGDLTGVPACGLAIQYVGSTPGYVALSVEIQSRAGVGGTPLYDGSNATGLTFSISDGHASYEVPTGPGSTGGSCPAGFTCWTASDDLAAWYSGSIPGLAFTGASAPVTWTVSPSFPTTVGNAYQGGSATLILTAHAVQTSPNPLPSACSLATVGQDCPSSGGFTW